MRPYLALKLTHTLSVSWPDKILYNTRTWSSTHVLHSLKLLQMSSGLYRDVKLQDGGSIRPIIGWLLHRNTLSAIAAMAVSTLLFFCQSLARSNFINTYRFSQNEKKSIVLHIRKLCFYVLQQLRIPLLLHSNSRLRLCLFLILLPQTFN